MIHTIKSNQKLYLIWFIMTICIIFSVMSTSLLSVAALGIFLISVLFMSTGDIFSLLFGLIPLANIFKLGPGSTSFFTLCEIALIMAVILKKREIKTSLVIAVIALLSYMMIFSYKNISILTFIKVLVGFCMFSFSTYIVDEKNIKNAAYLLALSTIVMLLLSLTPSYFAYVEPFFDDLNYYVDSTGHATEVMRNSGFFGDPNYCALHIVVTMSLLCLLYYYKKMGTEFWVIFALLVSMGFFTYSKSYFLCVALLILFLIIFVLFPKHKLWACISVIGIAVVISLALSGRIEGFNMIFERCTSGGDLTTGRISLNETYLSYIWNDVKVLLCGAGITVEHFIGAGNNVHNIYIELFFKMGVIGSIVYLTSLFAVLSNSKKSVLKEKKKFVNYIPLIFVLLMYYFLAGILNYAMPFYVIIAYLAINYGKIANNV